MRSSRSALDTAHEHANVIRILVPLTASDALLDEGLGLMAEAFAMAAAA